MGVAEDPSTILWNACNWLYSRSRDLQSFECVSEEDIQGNSSIDKNLGNSTLIYHRLDDYREAAWPYEVIRIFFLAEGDFSVQPLHDLTTLRDGS